MNGITLKDHFMKKISNQVIQLDPRTRRNKGKTSKFTVYVAK